MQTVDERKRLVEHFCAYEAHQFFLKVQEAGVRRCVCRRHDMEDSVAPQSHIDVLHGDDFVDSSCGVVIKADVCVICPLVGPREAKKASYLPYSDTVRQRSSCSMY